MKTTNPLKALLCFQLIFFLLFCTTTVFGQKSDISEDPYDYGEDGTVCVRNEFIISFSPDIINQDAIYHLELQNGKVGDFIKPEIIAQMIAAGYFDSTLYNIPLSKIYPNLTPEFTTSLARDGIKEVPMGPVWSTFLMKWDNLMGMDYWKAMDSLKYFGAYVHFTEPNWVFKLQAVPNDMHYQNNHQLGLGAIGTNPAGRDISAEQAWDYSVGTASIKVGVVDCGVNQLHQDLSFASTKVVAGGFNYFKNVPLATSSNDISGHGSMIAGIVGAVRNNDMGIAGIAGGDNTIGKMGVRIYDLKAGDLDITQAAAMSAIHEGASKAKSSSGKVYGHGLNIMNYSFGFFVGNQAGPVSRIVHYGYHAMREVIYYASENQCTQIASIGNVQKHVGPTDVYYPAQYHDNCLLRVGGYDFNGNLWSGSNYLELGDPDNDIVNGVVAPATMNLYTSLDHATNSSYNSYTPGTSVACAFATGAAGLIQSYYRDYAYKSTDLTAEDVYHLIRKYSDFDGQYKYLNAGNILKEIAYPDNKIIHYDFSVPVSSFVGGVHHLYTTSNFLVTANQGVWCEDPSGNTVGIYAWPAPTAPGGVHLGKPYTAEVHNAYILVDLSIFKSAGVSIKDRWIRAYDCTLKPNWQLTQNAEIEYCKLLVGGYSGSSLPPLPTNDHTYVIGNFYHIIANPDGTPMDLWYPFNPHKNPTRQVWYGISVQTYELNANALSDDINLTELSISPNPSNRELFIHYTSNQNQNMSITIVDVCGKNQFTVQHTSKTGENTQSIDVSDLQQGIYFVNLTTGNSSTTKKIYVTK